MFGKKRVYLDYAAAHPVRRSAARAYARAQRAYGNPSSPHEEGTTARTILEVARTRIARLTETKPDDVVFTSGATESNNLAIRGLARPGFHMLYLPSAHASIVETMGAMRALGVMVEPLPIKEGRVDIKALEAVLRPETILVSMDAVCGETGTVWNTREVAQTLRARSPVLGSFGPRPQSPVGGPPGALQSRYIGAYFHVDASQAPLTQKFTRSHFRADLLTLDAAKVGGERGVGVLIAHRTIPLGPLLTGGSQERGLRSGTPSPALAASFAVALAEAAQEREALVARAKRVRSLFIERITALIPRVYINEGAEGSPATLNLSLPGRDTDYLLALLDEAGFAISTRSACETESEEGSRAVLALVGDEIRAKATLRISWGSATSERELLRFARALSTAVAFVDKGAT